MAAKAKWSPKDPTDVSDYWFDFGSTEVAEGARFLPAAEVIVTATATVPEEGDLMLLLVSSTDKTVCVRVEGGAAGSSYDVDCVITTSAGQVFEQTGTLKVAERKAAG